MKSNTVIRISIVLSILVLLSGCNGGGTSNNPQNGSPSIPEININAIPTPTVSPTPASTPVESVLYSFQGGSDGSSPRSALIMGANGNLYGTTYYGGAMNYGTVFKITSQGQETILYSFQGGNDGAFPSAGLIMDVNGNLYGTTYEGGGKDTGTVFKISPQGQETILYDFQGGTDGSNPLAGLIMDANGNLYGTTNGGGNNTGTVFKISPNGVESVLHYFESGLDGSSPQGTLVLDSNGNLYGTTTVGGINNSGTVFKITSQGQETILYSFQGGNDGANPLAGLILDATGNLYGTTYEGGGKDTGTVFKISPQGQEIILYRFQSGFDARNPAAGLIMDVNGNLYGTTAGGGSNYSGAVFKITPQGEETVLYSLHLFENDGAHPVASLIMDANGNLYGTTSYGGILSDCLDSGIGCGT
ncbi:MAG: hypothetical protein RL017_857, partial [Pseudomonadota bacterium]